jgi:hypothetical protein
MAVQQGSDPLAALYDLITSQRITAVIHVAAKLGIADLLAEGPKTPDELAERTGAHLRSLRRLLRSLIAIGICRPTGDGKFERTVIGAHLAGDADPSLKAWALFEGEWLWRSWGGLLDSIRTGKTATELAGFDDRFAVLARTPEAAKTFNDAMVAMTNTVAPAVAGAYDFSAIGGLIDVGGGYGQLMIAILKAYPSLRGTVFDLPHCADGANERITSAGLGDRCDFVGGSFFESVPVGAGALILKSIIHDWDDGRSVKILGNCRKALTNGRKLLLVERVMPEEIEAGADGCSITMSDLNMLRGPGGCERTESEYAALLRQGGFRLARILPAGRFSIIDAVAVEF